MNFRYTFPPMEEVPLENGMTLICVPDHEQAGLVLALQLPVGRFSDPAGREGLCEITFALLTKGTASFSSDEFSLRLEHSGASLFTDVGEEHTVIGIRMLSAASGTLIPMFIDMIARPRFANDEFIRLRQEMNTSLQAEAVDTGLIATRHFYTALAGSDHPTGKFATVGSLKRITLDEVKSFFDNHCSPKNAFCVIAGDMRRESFVRFAVEQFSLWRRERREAAVIAPAVPHPPSTTVRLIDKNDLTQVSLIVGQASRGETDKRRNALLLGNYIFGGGNFSSRLMTRIRTGDGRTYGISSQLPAESEFGAFLISTSTRNAELSDVLKSIIDEFCRFHRDGVSAQEFERAKQFAIGNMAFQLEGIGSLVDKLLWLRFYGRPLSYIERFQETIAALELATVNEAIRSTFSPDNLVIIAVGKRDETESSLAPYGPIRHSHFRDAP